MIADESDYLDESDYFAELPEATRTQLRAIAWKYLRRYDIPDLETFQQLLALQQLHTDLVEAHAAWLQRARTAVLAQGLPWTPEEMTRYAQENPDA